MSWAEERSSLVTERGLEGPTGSQVDPRVSPSFSGLPESEHVQVFCKDLSFEEATCALWGNVLFSALSFCFSPQVEQNWATLQGGEMTIQTTQASEATQAVASLAEAAVAASQEMQQGATVTMALNRYGRKTRPEAHVCVVSC